MSRAQQTLAAFDPVEVEVEAEPPEEIVEWVPPPADRGGVCQNCGEHVTEEFMRVMVPDGAKGPEECPFCNLEERR